MADFNTPAAVKCFLLSFLFSMNMSGGAWLSAPSSAIQRHQVANLRFKMMLEKDDYESIFRAARAVSGSSITSLTCPSIFPRYLKNDNHRRAWVGAAHAYSTYQSILRGEIQKRAGGKRSWIDFGELRATVAHPAPSKASKSRR